MTEGKGAVVRIEQALSGRSTCRATGEKIEKGGWRVGLEVWLAGRMSWTWQKPLPFLEACSVEYCLKTGNLGTCKVTAHKFKRGEVRFVCTSGADKRVYLSLPAAAQELGPVLKHVGPGAFKPLQFKGVGELAAAQREDFCQAFGVPKAEAARFNKAHPAPDPPSFDSEPPRSAKRARGSATPAGGGQAAGAEVSAEAELAAAGTAAPGSSADAGTAAGTAGVGGAVSAGATTGAAAGSSIGGWESDAAVGGEAGAAAGQEGGQGMRSMLLPPAGGGLLAELTDYEQKRLEQIRRNKERMMALQLPAMAAELAGAEKPPRPRLAAKPKGLSTTRKHRLLEDAAAPRRSSLRVQGKAPDGSQVHSERRGEIIVVSGEHIRYNPAAAPRQDAVPQERHLKGDLAFQSTGGDSAADAAFVELLARTAATAAGPAAAPGGAGGGAGARQKPPTAAQLAGFQLAESDIAKVTRGGIVHLAFNPTATTLLLACADKYGHLGLWHVDHQPSAGAAGEAGAAAVAGAAAEAGGDGVMDTERGEGAGPKVGEPASAAATEGAAVHLERQGSAAPSGHHDGVLQLKPHLEYISGLKWAGGGVAGAGAATKLFTGSYDGSVRVLDLGAGGVSHLAFGDEELEFSAMDVTADGSLAILGDNLGEAYFVDLRAGKVAQAGVTIHNRKVNTVHLEPSSEQVFVTASTDSTIHLWDTRTLGSGMKPLATAQHSQTCQSAYFAPDGSRRVASTSFDDTVRVWDASQASLEPLTRARHDNQTGRWVFPFRAVWGPAADCLVIGNMRRYVDVLDASSGELQRQLSGEGMTAIAARNCVHPTLPALAAATASGRVHVYR